MCCTVCRRLRLCARHCRMPTSDGRSSHAGRRCCRRRKPPRRARLRCRCLTACTVLIRRHGRRLRYRSPRHAAYLPSDENCATQHYDIAIDLQGSIRSAVIARMSGAARVIGSATPREAQARLLYTQRVPTHAVHVVQQALEIASAAIEQPVQEQSIQLPHDVAAEGWCDGLAWSRHAPHRLPRADCGMGRKAMAVSKVCRGCHCMRPRGLRVLVNKAGPNDTVADDLLTGSPRLRGTGRLHGQPVDRDAAPRVAGHRRRHRAAAPRGCPEHAVSGTLRANRSGAQRPVWRAFPRSAQRVEHHRSSPPRARPKRASPASPPQRCLRQRKTCSACRIPYVAEAAHTLRG